MALSRDVNQYIRAAETPAEFVQSVLADRLKTDPLWIGFVEDPKPLGELLGRDVTGYLLLLPAEAPRHVQRDHEHDGGNQRLAAPADYDRLASVINQPDKRRLGDLSRNGNATVIVTKSFGEEALRAVFEVLPGRRNRSLALISLVVQVGR